MNQHRLTRRSLLAGAALGASSLAAAPGVRAAPAAVFGLPVGAVHGSSAVIGVGRRFSLVGVQWRGARQARIELRARLAGGDWSRWVNASVAGHGPDRPRRRDLNLGDPLWSGDADAVQLRSATPVSGVRLQFVAAAPSAGAQAASAFPLAQPQLPAGSGQPAIIARSAWAHGHAPPKYSPGYGAVRLGFVHHTDNLNGYAAGEVASMIHNMYLYHRYSNGWNDIGYNFVIDAFGRIWEARAGGIDQPVIGAQAGGYNLESTGVAILGTFSDVLPSAAALAALERLLAWKLSLHGIPTTGEVTVKVDPGDAFYTPFRPGQRISLPRVAGHRQGCTTDCPGNVLFAHLNKVRANVARLAGTAASLTLTLPGPGGAPATDLDLAAATAVAGIAGTAAGRLTTLAGQPLAGQTIEVQRLDSGGASMTIATALTAADGSWTAAVTLTENALMRALHGTAPAVVSPLVAAAVGRAVTLNVVSTAPLTVAGTINPPNVRTVTVEVYRAGTRQVVQSQKVTVVRGAYTVTLPIPPGSYEVYAQVKATATNAAGATGLVPVTI